MSRSPWKSVGSRFFHPDHWSKAGFTLYAATTDHPAGPWESVFAKSPELIDRILLCVNTHDALVAALERLVSYGDMFRYRVEEGNPYEQACAALAAAKGEKP